MVPHRPSGRCGATAARAGRHEGRDEALKVTVELAFDIDEAGWAQEYGLGGVEEAEQDIKTAFDTALADDGLVAVIMDNWPVMRDHKVTAKVTATSVR